MGLEIEVDPVRSFNGTATIFNNTEAVFIKIHSGAKGIVPGVRGHGTIAGEPQPGEGQSKGDHPGTADAVGGKKAVPWLMGFGAAGGFAAVWLAFVFSITDISVPEIELEALPASPLPAAAFSASAVGGHFHFADRHFRAATKKTGR